jgi:catechol 2,3-dioxygenase-like lactoylglutathione lyase family enzyme
MREAGEPLLGWPSWIGVVLEDLEAGRRFYRDVLGMAEVDAGEGWVQFDGGGGMTFELLALDPATPAYDGRRYQVGFTVSDIQRAREELVRRGVEPVGEIEGGPEAGSYWSYFRDLEGNVFEITQRLGGDPGASSA